MRKMVVTGGLGFIGCNFIQFMLSRHRDVRIVNVDACLEGSNPESLKKLSGNSRYEFVRGDICDKDLMGTLVDEAEVVVNFAAQTHVDRSIANPASFFKSNLAGTFTLLEAARKSDLGRLIQVSTDEVYGPTSATLSRKEVDALDPTSPYSASKGGGDLLVLAYRKTYGLNANVVRSTNNFGPFQSPEKFIPKTIIRALKGLEVPIYGSGSQIRDWIFVSDFCAALDTISGVEVEDGIFNVSAGNEEKNIQVAKMVLDLMKIPDTRITFVEDRPGHDIRYSLDSSKIRKLGWRPKSTFKSALRDTVDWYLQHREWWEKQATSRLLDPTPWKLKW